MNANFCVFDFYFSLEAMPEAPRSETLVAGLGSVLAILQPETMTVCRYGWIERPCHYINTAGLSVRVISGIKANSRAVG